MSGAVRDPEPQPVGAWRGYAVLALFGVGVLALVGRAFDLQVREQAFLENEGAKRFERTIAVPAGRAAIRDRRGEPLALSAPVASVWAVPSDLLADPENLPLVARAVGRQPAELAGYLRDRQHRSYVRIARQIPPTDGQRVKDLKAAGVTIEREYRRFYPAGEVAAQLVGFVSADGDGQEGMERAFDAQLQGVPGSRRVIRDAKRRIVEDLAEFTPPEPGEDVTLSIDLRLQYVAYRELAAAVSSHKARGGLILMLEPQSGEILAMASQPGFNPNNRVGMSLDGLRNRPAVDQFEPGSTVKPLLMAWALDQGVISADSTVQTGAGFHRVGALIVKDAAAYGELDMAGVLMKSSNIGASKIGFQLGADGVYEGYTAFGFGLRAGSGFPNEASGVLRHFSGWGDIATATSSYGYGLSVTALQLARGYSAIADDGRLRFLSLLHSEQPQAVERQVVSPAAARQLRRWLERVVAPGGTATRAGVDGYRVAGKTGTTRKVNAQGEYTDAAHLASFVGMMPVEEPRVVTLVVIDEPMAGQYYGGRVAAPVFSRVMESAARVLQIPPARVVDESLQAAVDAGAKS